MVTLGSASWFSAILRGFFAAGFPMDDINHARLRSHIPLEEDSKIPKLLADTVGKLPALTFIKVSGLIAPCIVQAGFSHLGKDGDEPMPFLTPPFPRLESIHCHRVPFLPSNEQRDNALGFVDLELLQRFLVARSATLRQFRLEECFHLTKADVAELCRAVGDSIRWDGLELGEDDY